jgi:UDP-glucose 4-epimerase
MHYLVTGGAGFIGSHVTEQLLSEGHCVTVIDNLATGYLSNLSPHPRLTVIPKNVSDCQPDEFQSQIDGIVHLAATASVHESWRNPLENHHNNLSVMIAVLMLCQSLNIPRLVFASSAAVYGNTIYLPIVETHPVNPISPYGLQKLTCEQYAGLFAKQMGFSCVALRLFNVFGPRQRPNSAYSGVISTFTSAMQQGRPITLYGLGTQSRDFVYVKDVARAFSDALTYNMQPGTTSVFNIGSGTAVSINQLLDELQDLFPQWRLTPHYAPARQGDIQHSCADIARAIAALNFTPQWSIQAGLCSLVQTLMIAA